MGSAGGKFHGRTFRWIPSERMEFAHKYFHCTGTLLIRKLNSVDLVLQEKQQLKQYPRIPGNFEKFARASYISGKCASLSSLACSPDIPMQKNLTGKFLAPCPFCINIRSAIMNGRTFALDTSHLQLQHYHLMNIDSGPWIGVNRRQNFPLPHWVVVLLEKYIRVRASEFRRKLSAPFMEQ